MAESTEFFLQLKKFKDNTNKYWQKLRNEVHFSDVTLACSDKQVKAHKIVLAASSSVLEDIFLNNPQQNPFIYLKGVKYSELVSLLDFMYTGEVTIAKDSLDDFLAFANEFRIKGLKNENRKDPNELSTLNFIDYEDDKENMLCNDAETESLVLPNEYEISEHNQIDNSENKTLLSDSNLIDEDNISELMQNDVKIKINEVDKDAFILENSTETKRDDLEVFEDTNTDPIQYLDKSNNKGYEALIIPVTVHSNNVDDKTTIADSYTDEDELIQNDQQILIDSTEIKKDNSMFETIQDTIEKDTNIEFSNNFDYKQENEKQKICNLCNFKTEDISKFDIHKQIIHSDRHFCLLCNWSTTTKNKTRIKNHILAVHEGVFIECDQCEYKTEDQSNLKRHKRAMHGGKYVCEDCEYSAADTTNLKRHRSVVHDGVRIPCEQCDFKATRNDTLIRHVRIKHNNVCYSCKQCNFKTKVKPDLKKHENTKHRNQISQQ